MFFNIVRCCRLLCIYEVLFIYYHFILCFHITSVGYINKFKLELSIFLKIKSCRNEVGFYISLLSVRLFLFKSLILKHNRIPFPQLFKHVVDDKLQRL